MRPVAGKSVRAGALAGALAGLVALGTLGGCAATRGFRDPSAPISSTTRFEAARLAGQWQLRAAFTRNGEAPAPASIGFYPGPPAGNIALMELRGLPPGGSFGVSQIAPGRFVSVETGVEYWLIWVDADWRTAAIGTPSGAFGWVIARDKTGGEDRLKAARDVLQWVGYDVTRLREVP